ncbi:acetyltransferase [Clostridium cibarium]|uniref:Acetyltransferase n=1 Tax=Clostridium cibarium TaxID=2762247 RepID=A0ABR8PUB7_9CLOT|nr:acetyltransferase [Clostridium cibarium]MBD7911773.1 acetyltransferase [Clostridium cibarium]
MKDKIIIFGVGDFAKQIYYYLSESDNYSVECFTVDKCYIDRNELLGKKVVAFEEIEQEYPPESYKFITAIGYKSMRKRKELYERIKYKKYEFVNYIHKSVVINKPFYIGTNNIILSDVVIEPNVKVGSNNIVYSGTVIGHDSHLDDHSFISIGNKFSGFTHIEDLCFIGVGSIVSDNVKISRETLVGAGSLVLKDTFSLGIYYGVPAKRQKEIDNALGIRIE